RDIPTNFLKAVIRVKSRGVRCLKNLGTVSGSNTVENQRVSIFYRNIVNILMSVELDRLYRGTEFMSLINLVGQRGVSLLPVFLVLSEPVYKGIHNISALPIADSQRIRLLLLVFFKSTMSIWQQGKPTLLGIINSRKDTKC